MATTVRSRFVLSPRYGGLLFMSLGCVMFGFAYTPLSNVPAKLPAGLEILEAYVPIWVFGAMFMAAGISGVFIIATKRRGAWVFAAQVMMFSLWFAAYFTAWAFNGDPRSWLGASIYLIFAGTTYSLTRVDPPLWVLRIGRLWTRA